MNHPARAVRWIPAILLLLAAASLRAELPASVAQSPEETRKAFHEIIDRPKVDLEPKVEQDESKGGFAHFRFSYMSEAGQRVPGILVMKEELVKDGKRHPVVLALHGTGGKKEGMNGLLQKLAAKGFIGVAIDGRYHGERGAMADYHAAIATAFEKGGAHPLYYDTVWDLTRLIDYLETRPDVDAKRIGMIGFSKGGIETWITAAIDPRVAVAIPTISVQSFAWGLANNAWPARVGTVKKGFDAAAKSAGVEKPDAEFARKFYDRVLPGIYTQFDGPVLLPMIAPRPLLVIGGDKDALNPVPGLKIVEAATKAAYDKAGVSDKFHVIVEENTGHNVNAEATAAAVEWFAKWIGGDGK